MRHGYLQVAKAYILYREKHHHLRIVIDELMQMLSDDSIESLLIKIQKIILKQNILYNCY